MKIVQLITKPEKLTAQRIVKLFQKFNSVYLVLKEGKEIKNLSAKEMKIDKFSSLPNHRN